MSVHVKLCGGSVTFGKGNLSDSNHFVFSLSVFCVVDTFEGKHVSSRSVR